MDKTKVDDMLMQMIQPKLDEIEERFSKGEGLSGEDINTLLLKSQYNHINHLDMKLNEVTADVSSLKGGFSLLSNNFGRLEDKVNSRLDGFEDKINGLENKFNSRMDSLENKFNSRMDSLEDKMDSNATILKQDLELKVADAINKNMRWSIGLIALIVTVLKLVDTFAK